MGYLGRTCTRLNYLIVKKSIFVFLVLRSSEQLSNRLSISPISVVIPFARTLHDELYSMHIVEQPIDAVRTAMYEATKKRFFPLKDEK